MKKNKNKNIPIRIKHNNILTITQITLLYLYYISGRY